MKLIDYNELDVSSLSFSSPEKIKGSFMSLVSSDNNEVYIKTPKFKNNGLIKTDNKINLNLEFNNENIDFYEFLCNLDEYIIEYIHKNSNGLMSFIDIEIL